MTTKAIVTFRGFGLGIWRNRMSLQQVIWTIAIGPLTVHVSLSEDAMKTDPSRAWIRRT